MHPEIIFITASTKEAAGTKTWLRERLTPSAWVRMMGEGLVSDYAEKMEVLREVDDNIHGWTKDLDFIVSALEKALQASRIVDIGILLKDLNDRLRKVSIEGIRIEEVAEEALHQFDKEDPQYAFLSKEAGLIDDLKRRWVSNKLQTEKRKLRARALKSVIDFAKSIVKSVDAQLNLMSKHRASGDIGKYLDSLHKIGDLQKKFQEKFFPIYNEYLKDIVEETFNKGKNTIENKGEEKISEPTDNISSESESLVKVETPVEEPVLDLVNRKIPDLQVSSVGEQTSKEKSETKGEEKQEEATQSSMPEEETMPEPKEDFLSEEEKEEENTKKALNKFMLKQKHANFLNSLAKIAEVDHKEAVQFMFSYAKKIEKQDPQAAWKLFAIAEGFVE